MCKYNQRYGSLNNVLILFLNAFSTGMMEPTQYAKVVAATALSTRPGAQLWAGSYASTLWFFNTSFGHRILVSASIISYTCYL